MSSDFYLNQQTLENLYVNQRKSTRDIALLLNVSQSTINRKLSEFSIPRRSYKENKMPVPKGGTLSESHKAAISAATQGRVIINPETGHGYKWDKVEVQCSNCGQTLLKKKCHSKAKKFFCSDECRSQSMIGEDRGGKVQVSCSECSKPLIRARYLVARKPRFFCDQKCAGLWKCKNLTGDKVYNYKGGYDQWEDYGPSWPHDRRLALERDNHSCQICGITSEQLGKEPDVHHVVPFRLIGKECHEKANRLSNLRCLCPKHHTQEEQKDNSLAENYANIVRGIHIIRT